MPASPRPEQLLAAIQSLAQDGLLSFSLDGIIETWGSGAVRLYGYTRDEMLGQPVALLLPHTEMPAHEQLLRAARIGNFPCWDIAERVHKDGSRIRVMLQRAAIRNENDEILGLVETGRILGSQSECWPLNCQLRPLLEQVPAVVWTTDQQLRITSSWGILKGASGNQSEVVGRSIHDYLKCEDPHAVPVAQHAEALRGITSHFEYRHRNRDFEIRLAPFRGPYGEIVGCIGTGIDITERKQKEAQIHYQATHDALTGLANYREFIETLECEVRRADRSNRCFAVLLLDLDDLKQINDHLGHLAGNRALQRLADVMREHCRSTDLAARYGGDEFALLLIDADPGMAQQVAGRVERALRDECEEPSLNVSIGVSIYPDDGRTGQQLLEAADQHLYDRKKVARAHSVASR